jgi:short-subunit dehydrogenase
VSGGAQGIGAAYTERLADLGMPVLLLDNHGPALEAQVAKLRAAHPQLEFRAVQVDLSDAAALNAVLNDIADLEIGLLVANAGRGAVGRWLEVTLETKLNQIALNCGSPVVLAHRLTPAMAERRRGGVIVMASGSADMGSSFIVSYAATKAFDRVFAEGLWAELSPYGIDVTTVMPGAVNTPGFRDTVPAGHEPIPQMQPVSPFTVVDAALEGLGSKINVRPGMSGFQGLMFAALMRFVPRRTMIGIGNKAVRAMYDR